MTSFTSAVQGFVIMRPVDTDDWHTAKYAPPWVSEALRASSDISPPRRREERRQHDSAFGDASTHVPFVGQPIAPCVPDTGRGTPDTDSTFLPFAIDETSYVLCEHCRFPMSHGITLARITSLQKVRFEGTRDPLEKCENPGCPSNGGSSSFLDEDNDEDDCPPSGEYLIGEGEPDFEDD
jgi:hypothetical protein